MTVKSSRIIWGFCFLAIVLNTQVQAALKVDGTSDDTEDVCPSHEPLESTPLGCIFGPLGKDLELPECSNGGKHTALRPRLKNTVTAIDEALKAIEDELDIPKNEVAECLNSTMVSVYDEAMKLRLRKAVLSSPESPSRTITVGMGGSSVTAGHDNLYAQAYPFAFQRAAHCAFKAAGIDLVVRDTALGANQEFQYALCNSVIYGEDTDLVMWEFNAMSHGDNKAREAAMRSFFNPQLFPNRPSFIFTGDAGVSTRQIWGDLTANCSGHNPDCIPAVATNLCANTECKQKPCDKCGEAGQTMFKAIEHQHGVWYDMMKKYAEWGTGMFQPQRCIYRHTDKWMFQGSYTLRAGKQLGQAKGWHYGPWGHRMYGRMLAHWYLTLFKDVVQDLQTQIPNDVKEENQHHWSRGFLAGLSRASASTTFPEPNFCKENMKECKPSPQCATTMEPRQPKQWPDLPPTTSGSGPSALSTHPQGGASSAGESTFDGVVVRPGSDDLLGWAALLDHDSAPLMDMRDYCTEWSHCPQELDQRAKDMKFFQGTTDVQRVVNSGKWAVSIVDAGESRGEVQRGWSNQWGWRDRKYVLQGNAKSGALKLKLPAKQKADGFLVCGAPFCNFQKDTKTCRDSSTYRVPVQSGFSVEVDGKAVPEAKLTNDIRGGELCVMVETEMNPGIRSITIRGTHPEKMVNIGHIIWW